MLPVVEIKYPEAMGAAMAGDGGPGGGRVDAAEPSLLNPLHHGFDDVLGGGRIGDEANLAVWVIIFG